MSKIIIYTDGSCIKNPGPGGWACLLKFNDKEKILSGGEKKTTNNKMELTAIIKALKQINIDKYPIELYTDSKYVLNGITSRIKKWKKNNWKTANNYPVKNKDLWQELDNLIQKLNIKIYWIKGHSGCYENELVDKLAQKEARKYLIIK